MSKIAVVGTGYVGLTTGACLSQLGHDVICADIDPKKVESLTRGVIPIVEEGLEDIVRSGIRENRLRFVLGASGAVSEADFVFLCLPTPEGENGSADLTYLKAAAAEIAPHLRAGAVVINKSTVPVGSAEEVEAILNRPDVAVASNPEFLREGSAVYDFLNPDRIVIGARTKETAESVAALYALLKTNVCMVDTRDAELVKYASNAFLALKLSYVNSIAALSEGVGASASQVLAAVGQDTRIGPAFLTPGPGWGGSCFPKDVQELLATARSRGVEFSVLESAVQTNVSQYARMAAKVVEMLGGDARGMKIAAWGLSFKAGTDDTRESPALHILKLLHDMGAQIHAYDPEAHNVPSFVDRKASALEACMDADILVILTEWQEFAQYPLGDITSRMVCPRIADLRGMLSLVELERSGIEYYSLGHGNGARVLA